MPKLIIKNIEENETTTQTNLELTLPSQVMRSNAEKVQRTIIKHMTVLSQQQTIATEEAWMKTFTECFTADFGFDALPEWITTELNSTQYGQKIAADCIKQSESLCICGSSGLDSDCEIHARNTNTVYRALSLSI